MALPREYTEEDCPIARTLEIVGERWTLLIIRDAFYGVSRFSDFRDHLGVPRAVLTERLNLLVEHGILVRTPCPSGRDEYTLTPKGEGLWPTIWSLITWGNEHYMPGRPVRRFTHNECGGTIGDDGRCGACGALPMPRELTLNPRPDPSPVAAAKTDPVSRALRSPHPLFSPIVRTSA